MTQLSPTQLSPTTLSQVSAEKIAIPSYITSDKKKEVGIVHLGPGAFFRGHQAWYTHKAMELAGGDWGISCVSMHSQGVQKALKPQNGLYTLAVLDVKTEYELIGAVQEVLVSHQNYDDVLLRLTNPKTRFVTMTITEKGYCLDNEGKLDLTHSDIKADLLCAKKVSAIGLLVEALSQRKAAGVAPFTALSCDNLTDNGKKLRAALIAYAQQFDESLAQWLEQQLICPCSMVDSITPATNDELRAQVSTELGIEDNWPIKRESFVQWVIEDILPEDKPAWDKAGATFTSDVRGFENAKLRLLNCPHSTMAYMGVLANIETVYDAMLNDELVRFIQQMVADEIIPSFVAPKELDAEQYMKDILQRFRNPAIRHLLAQIAWDGSQKLPMRILPIIEQNISNNIAIDKLCSAVVAWCLFIRKRYISDEELVDPLAEKMLAIAKNCTDVAAHDIDLFLQLTEVFGTWLPKQASFVASLTKAYKTLVPSLRCESIEWEAL